MTLAERSPELPSRERTTLTFEIDGEVCGIDLSAVVEVVEYQGVTRVPFAPSHVLGVFNLRGSVLPVVDLASRLGLARAAPNARTCIIVVLAPVSGEVVRVGLLANSMRTVLSYEATSVESSPQMGARVSAEFLEGIVGHADGFVFLLNLEKVLSLSDSASLGAAAALTSGVKKGGAVDGDRRRDLAPGT